MAQQRNVGVRGRVQDNSGSSIPGAAIELRSENDSSISVIGLTDDAGMFLLRVRSAVAGRWLLSAHRLGYAPVTRVASLDSADRVWSITMLPRPFSLEPLRSVAKRIQSVEPRRDPGSTGRGTISSIALRQAGDPGSLVEAAQHLSPSVLPVIGADGSIVGISIAGEPPSATGTVVDGATTDQLSLPSEALSAVRTFASTYDVSRGQFGSGQVAARTRSGTDTWQGVIGTHGMIPVAGASRVGPGSSVLWSPRQTMLSAGGGGPLVPRWLYAYGAIDATRSARTPLSVLDADARSADLFRVSGDSVRRIESVADGLGLGSLLGRTAVSRATSVNGVARFDAPLTAAHTATLRVELSSSRSTTAGPFSLSGPVSRRSADAGGMYLGLTSSTSSFLNEARLYYLRASSRGAPSFSMPQAAVWVSSRIRDSLALEVLTIGENGSVFGAATSDAIEVTDDLSLTSARVAGKIIAGFALRSENATQLRGSNPYGRFSFPDIASFEAARPSAFTRTLTDPSPAAAGIDYAAAYLGSTSWIGNLGFTTGIRAEVSRYLGRDTLAPSATVLAVDGASPRVDGSVSPRIGFRYSPRPALSFFGGTGDFRAPIRATGFAGPVSENGTSAVRTLSCVGASAPTPQWSDYIANASSIPESCAAGAPSFASTIPATTLFARGFRAPHIWRSSLASQVGLGLTSLSVEASYSTSRSQPVAVDRNLVVTPHLLLAEEGQRPVFVAVSDIDPTSGGIAPLASRRDRDLGLVRQIDARGRSRNSQISAQWGGLMQQSSTFASVGYAFTVARVEGTALPVVGGQSQATASDPNALSWFDSRFAARHSFQITLDRFINTSFTATIAARIRSRPPYTPLVLGDVNGDGLNDDRAFVFDPQVADPAVARGMRDLLARQDRAADCLARQLGRVAGAGSCRSAWTRSIDVSTFYAPRRIRGLTISLRAINVLAGVDRLLHGASPRGWGDTPIVDENLLVVRGFDPTRVAYRYDVNPNFGQARRDLSVSAPFALQLRARLAFGGDPARPAVGAGAATPPGNANQAELEASLRRAIVNTPAAILALYETRSFDLTTSQVIRLHVAMDSLQRNIDANVAALVLVLGDGPTLARDPEAQARHRALEREALDLLESGVRTAQRIVGPLRWGELPSTVQSPLRVIPRGVVRRGASGG